MNKGLIIILFFTPIFPIFGMDWPIWNAAIVTTFGSSTGEGFSVGVSVTGEKDTVRAAEDGEIIFSVDSGEFSGKIPSGFGNLVILQHEGGLLSGYAHLQPGSSDFLHAEDPYVEKGVQIGKIGDSGWSYGLGLGLFIFDTEFSQFVNPLLVLPQRSDALPPVLENLQFAYGDNEIGLEDDISIEQGSYRLYADIYDVNEFTQGFTIMAPYSITVFVNGAETSSITFEGLKELDGKTYLLKSEDKTFTDMYINNRTINLGKYTLSPGRMSVEIRVADYAGNESGIIKTFTVSGQ